MVRGSIKYAKMSHNNNVSKYEDLHIDDLSWTICAIFGRFCYGKLYNLCIEKCKKYYTFIHVIAAYQ